MSKTLEESPLQAGREAIARHAWRDGFELLNQADVFESLAPEDLEALAEAAWWIGRLDDCIAARERAFAIYLDRDEPRRSARVALSLAQDYFDKHANSIGAGWFSKAERLLEDQPEGVEHGYLSMMHAFSLIQAGDLDAVVAEAQRMLDIGMRYGDRDLQAYALAFQGKALVRRGDVRAGLSLLDESTVASVSGELGPLASGMVYCMAISASASVGDYRRAGEWTEASQRWCERQSIAGFPGICRVHRAEIMRLRGSWIEAEQDARRAVAELQNFNLMFAAEGFYELGEIRFRMGDLEGAEDAFRQAHELGREPQPGLALLRLVTGRADSAATSIRRAIDEPSLDRLGLCRLLPAQVEIALAAGDLTTAAAAAQNLEELAETYDSGPVRASALCARGQVELAEGNVEGAMRTLRDCWRLWNEADLPYEAAKARLLLGVALRTDGDEDGAVLEMTAAKSVFEKLGAVLDLRNALELLGEDVAEGLPKATVPAARTTKTFMFTDIVSSTNLVEALGDDAWENLLGWHDQALRKLFAAHSGEEVKQIGDGFFVAFDDPLDAVECAVGIQLRLRQQRKEHGFAPQVRIGLHTADAVRKGSDYGGKGVHTAARIGALAEGGEILASIEVVKSARTRWPSTEPRRVPLKGFADPIEVASIETG